jgi:hypothetical protein
LHLEIIPTRAWEAHGWSLPVVDGAIAEGRMGSYTMSPDARAKFLFFNFTQKNKERVCFTVFVPWRKQILGRRICRIPCSTGETVSRLGLNSFAQRLYQQVLVSYSQWQPMQIVF